jgi:hypothetical protein
MIEKRSARRYRKRLRLRYGVGRADTMGFTEDISPGGMFVTTTKIKPVSTLLTIELTTPADQAVLVEGTVQWTKSVIPSMLRLGMKGGMGIMISRFISGHDTFQMLCQASE